MLFRSLTKNYWKVKIFHQNKFKNKVILHNL